MEEWREDGIVRIQKTEARSQNTMTGDKMYPFCFVLILTSFFCIIDKLDNTGNVIYSIGQ
jgi:hypothetical protein